nr:polyprotein 1 [Pineapple secovirus A]
MTNKDFIEEFEQYSKSVLLCFPDISDDELVELFLEYKILQTETQLLPETKALMGQLAVLDNTEDISFDKLEDLVKLTNSTCVPHLLLKHALAQQDLAWTHQQQIVFIGDDYLKAGKMLDIHIGLKSNSAAVTEGLLESAVGGISSALAYTGTTILLKRLAKIPQSLEKVDLILQKILDGFSWVGNLVDGFQATLSAIKANVLRWVNQALDKMKWFSENFSFIFPIFVSVFLVCSVSAIINTLLSSLGYEMRVPTARLFEIAAVASSIYVLPELGAKLLMLTIFEKTKLLNSVWSLLGINGTEVAITDDAPQEPTAESGDVALFTSLLTFVTFFTNWEVKSGLLEMMKWSTSFKGACDGFEKFKTISSSISMWAYEHLGVGKSQEQAQAQHLLISTGIDLEKWCEDVETLIIEGNTSNKRMEELLTRSRELIDFYKRIVSFSTNQTSSLGFLLRERIKTVGKNLTDFEASVAQAKMMGEDRLTPFCFCVYSLPGMGKSIMMKRFKHDFLDAMEEPSEGRVYPRSPGDKYWSGYLKQTLVYYDDFAQCQQRDGGSDELDLIPLVSGAAHCLNMAAIGEKGRNFASKYIFLSTNRRVEAPEVMLADNNAFRRRRHLMVELVHAADVPIDPIRPFDHLRFRRLNPLEPTQPYRDESGVIHNELLTYPELLVLTIDTAKAHRAKEEALDAFTAAAGINPRAQSNYATWLFDPTRFAENSIECPHFKADPTPEYECYGVEDGDPMVFSTAGTLVPSEIWTPAEIRCCFLTAERQTQRDLLDALHMSAFVDEGVSTYGLQCLFDNVDKIHLAGGDIRAIQEFMQEPYAELWSHCSARTRYLMQRKARYYNSTRSSFALAKDKIMSHIRNFKASELWASLPVSLKWLCAGLALCTIGLPLLWTLRKCLTAAANGPATLALALFTGSKMEGTSSGGDERVMRVRGRRVRAFMQGSNSATDIVSPEAIMSIQKAQCYIQCHTRSGKYMTCCGYFSGPRKITTTTHDMAEADFTRLMCLVDFEGNFTHCAFNPAKFYVPQENGRKMNLCTLELPYTANPHHSVGHLNKYDFIRGMSAHCQGYVLPNLRMETGEMIRQVTYSPVLRSEEILDVKTGKHWPATHLFQAALSHTAGFCGRLALIKSESGYNVVGMHVAGTTIMGKEYSYFSELFSALEPTVVHAQGEAIEETMIFEHENPKQLTPMVSKIGYLSRQLPKLEKSQIVPSPIHGALVTTFRPPSTEPTLLKAGDPRAPIFYDPYAEGVVKFVEETGPFSLEPQSDESIVMQDILHTWRSQNVPLALPTVTSLEVAINGQNGLEYAEALPISTGEGFPSILERKHGESGKFRYFEEAADGTRILLEEPLARVNEIEAAAETGDLEIFTIACAKDEKTAIKKVRETPKTRIFEILPFEFNIIIRKYFLFWMQWMMSLHNKLPCKVGLNPYSQSWDLMAHRHCKFDQHFCGDYSGFDTGTNVEIMLRFADLISEFANDGEKAKRIRRNLMRAAVTRKMIVGADVYRINGGTPSGFALTVMINSLMNEFYLRLAWRKLSPHADLRGNFFFSNHVVISVYGDDNVVSFSSDVAPWYNLETISKELARYGVKLGDGRKTGAVIKWQRFDEIDFLKRSWVPVDTGVYMCPISRTSIEEQLFWIKAGRTDNDDHVESLTANCVNVMRESFFHGHEYWFKIFGIITQAFQAANLEPPILPSFQECEQFWRSQREGQVQALPIEYSLNPSLVLRFVQGSLVQHITDDITTGGTRQNAKHPVVTVVPGATKRHSTTGQIVNIRYGPPHSLLNDLKSIVGPVHFVDLNSTSKHPSEQAHLCGILTFLLRNQHRLSEAFNEVKSYLCLISDKCYNAVFIPSYELIKNDFSLRPSHAGTLSK